MLPEMIKHQQSNKKLTTNHKVERNEILTITIIETPCKALKRSKRFAYKPCMYCNV